jgi:hypothetical protein
MTMIKKELTKISKKCLELLYSMKICKFGRLSEKFHCGKSVFGGKLFFPSVFGGLSGRSGRSRVGSLDAVGSSGRPDDRPSGSGPSSGRSFLSNSGSGRKSRPDPITGGHPDRCDGCQCCLTHDRFHCLSDENKTASTDAS